MASPLESPVSTFSSNPVSVSNTAGANIQNVHNSNPSVSASAPTSSVKNTSNDNQPILTKPRLMELVREIDTSVQLDEDVEEIILQIADDFIEDAVRSASQYAKHRKATKLEVRDVQLHLERKYKMWLPGFGTDELRPYKRAAVTEAHKQRLALIRKTIKKY
ncbi:transcription initiation factor TFIID subunit 12-like isoform X2 [Teleopsis dalmanni]|nr:transcription initiation factor TFIID subunit 12 isoform X2 [Teleopsis dalmanni]XP_037948605.1 transcription initiation factor TFIID subunit 12-like isoform X2 [Teleopsis dalmanni]